MTIATVTFFMTADTKYNYYYEWIFEILIFIIWKQFATALDFFTCVKYFALRMFQWE